MNDIEAVARAIRNARVARQMDEASARGVATTDEIWWNMPPSADDLAQARAAIETIIERWMEPTQEMRIEGLQAFHESMEKRREYYDAPEQRERDYGSVRMMPTVGLLINNEDDSNPVWQAMLRAKLEEIKRE